MNRNQSPKQPTVFISYSWDNEEHKQWVMRLSDNLLERGIITLLDQKDLVLGDPLTQFMEQSIATSDYVLLICTPTYKQKADLRKGGVGYEESIITADVYMNQNHRKYIPILAKGSWETAIPTWASGKLGVDLMNNQIAGSEFEKLVAAITGVAKSKEVKVKGHQAKLQPTVVPVSRDEDEIRIVSIIKEDITSPRNDGTAGSALYAIPFQLSDFPSQRWSKWFMDAWRYPSRFTTRHRPSIAKINGDRIILDGTTIEEYRQFHHETLQRAVEVANNKEREWLEAEKREEERRAEEERQFRNNLASQLDDISF